MYIYKYAIDGVWGSGTAKTSCIRLLELVHWGGGWWCLGVLGGGRLLFVSHLRLPPYHRLWHTPVLWFSCKAYSRSISCDVTCRLPAKQRWLTPLPLWTAHRKRWLVGPHLVDWIFQVEILIAEGLVRFLKFQNQHRSPLPSVFIFLFLSLSLSLSLSFSVHPLNLGRCGPKSTCM